MSPGFRIPSHITALYTFAVVNLTILLNITLVEANVLVLNKGNKTITEFADAPANFGPAIPEDGLWGRVVYVTPHNACVTVEPPPDSNVTTWIALIRRRDCDFDAKVFNVQKAGYAAALIYNDKSDVLVPMGRGKKSKNINIPSAFIGLTDGTYLAQNIALQPYSFSVLLDKTTPFNPNLYLLPFAIVVGICFVLMLIFMLVKWIRDYRKKRRSRLSKANLKKIPIKKFKKGDPYDICAICLDEYEDGEKLRVLPCQHAYHEKCIDPWLTKNKRTCPICKRKVIPGDRSDSDSETDSDEENGNERNSENTPLLSAGNNNDRPRGGNTFDNSGLPSAVRPSLQDITYSDDSDGSEEPSSSYYQSSVEVHSTPRHQGQVHRDNPASLVLTNETQNHSDTNPLVWEELRGAEGGFVNPTFDVIEDHFKGEVASSPSSYDSQLYDLPEPAIISGPALDPCESEDTASQLETDSSVSSLQETKPLETVPAVVTGPDSENLNGLAEA